MGLVDHVFFPPPNLSKTEHVNQYIGLFVFISMHFRWLQIWQWKFEFRFFFFHLMQFIKFITTILCLVLWYKWSMALFNRKQSFCLFHKTSPLHLTSHPPILINGGEPGKASDNIALGKEGLLYFLHDCRVQNKFIICKQKIFQINIIRLCSVQQMMK